MGRDESGDEAATGARRSAVRPRRAARPVVLRIVDAAVDGRIEIVSNGKELPIDPGHNEAAWAMDRNDQFQNLTTNVVLR